MTRIDFDTGDRGQTHALGTTREGMASMLNHVPQQWVDHAYPLQQIKIELQGTKHSNREDIINQLETVLSRLRAGDVSGCDHDDDFGYRFKVTAEAQASFFDEPADQD